MNFLLSLNKKIFLIFSIIFFVIIFIIILYTFFQSSYKLEQEIIFSEKKSDISKPKFSINGKKQKISVTANEANFLNNDEIILENNVIFKSSKFKIYTDNVLFNKKTLVATSKNKSKFVSKKTSIDSSGFDIIEDGSIINFKGKTKLIIK